MSARRIFWGRSLAQAVAKAARHYQVAPELLDWRAYEKRHGFVRHQRTALVEVDPAAPFRAAPEPRAASTSPSPPAAAPAVRRDPAPSPVSAPVAPPSTAPATRAPRMVARRNDETFDAPDEESEQAALEAIGRLLRFAGIEASATIVRSGDRFEVALAADAEAAAELDAELLDELDHLLPKAILTLSGRRVRATVDFGGQREARAEELRGQATEMAARVRAGGESESFPALTAAERRVVHLLFENDPEIATESLGDGQRKKLRLLRRS